MKTSKKILSLVLAVIMVVCAVPMVYAEEQKIERGDIIYFGSYPQSEVTDKELIDKLNAAAPAWDSWTSYGYYNGNGELGSMNNDGNWMRYTDITYNNNKYRGVMFTQYRPNFTYSKADGESYQDDNGYTVNTIYWFSFDDIAWRVLNPKSGLVICETIIDAQPYSNTIYYNTEATPRYAYFNDAEYKHLASDYEKSSIRAWLNNDFYNTAFTTEEQYDIKKTDLINQGYYTSVGTAGFEKLDSDSTSDYIFLLSYNDVRNTVNGFNPSEYEYDEARKAMGSDYAKCQGLYVNESINPEGDGYSYWLLRSAGLISDGCCYVNYYGNSDYIYHVFYTYYGVRPAMRFNNDINSVGRPAHKHTFVESKSEATCTAKGYTLHKCSSCEYEYRTDYIDAKGHDYNVVVTAPTCKMAGYTTYTCACGAEYIADDVAKTTHQDADGDYKCDFECGYKFEKPATKPEETEEKEMTFFEKVKSWFKNFFNSLANIISGLI